MLKGAIFNMDGLLFDTERFFWKSGELTAGGFGQVYNPNFLPALGGSSWAKMPKIIHQFYPSVDAGAFRDAYTSRAMELIEQHGLDEKPGVQNILSFLRAQGCKIAVASSSGTDIIKSHLRRTGFSDFFDAVTSGTEVPHGKPAPDVFLLAARRLDLAPQECYVFEDSLNGVRAGMSAGCMTVMVPDMVQAPKDFHVSRICSSLDEAKNLIEAGNL